MPKRSIYFKDEQDSLYLRVKELTAKSGDTIASVFVKAMQDYVVAKEDELHDDKPIEIFVGERIHGFADCGDYAKFYGELIGKGQFETGVNSTRYQELYRTKKGKLLLYQVDEDSGDSVSDYKVYDRASELRDICLASEIISGLKNMEIGSRFIDV